MRLLDLFNTDFMAPDDKTVVWNLPRDAKTDIAVVLQTAFEALGIDAAVTKRGSFAESMLRDPETKKTRPVVCVSLVNDSARYFALGELDGIYQAGEVTATTPAGDPLLVDGTLGVVKNQLSAVSVEVALYDLNEQRADQMRLLVKTVMFAAADTFRTLGYLKPPLRTGGGEGTGTMEMDGGVHFLFTRTLSYQAEHLDFIGGIEQLGRLIAVRGNTDASIDPDGEAYLIAPLAEE